MLVHAVIRPVISQHPERTPQHVADQRAAARQALVASARLSGAPPEGYTSDDDGVPQVNDGWHWSVSHKRHFVAAVVARDAIGIDVEKICPRDPAAFAQVATATEWALLPARDDDAFSRMWTAKEAVVKALGIGMAGFDECRLTSVGAPGWRLGCAGAAWEVAHVSHAGHTFAVAGPGLKVQWHLPPA